MGKHVKDICTHERIYADEPRDGGGAYYKCVSPECPKEIDPYEWEVEHDKEWDWWM